ncbi:fibronectin type III domain-containing protein [Luminiphilus sp.]|nr:fibronectin type III domain-containing protein [Luminiphilus sp.]
MFAFLCLSNASNAGIYGAENWGEMYWGDNAVTTPIAAPTIASAVATEDQITITLDNFPVGTGADGWSAVTSFIVTCGATTVETSQSAVTITGLEGDTDYSCSVRASNALGDSPTFVQVVTTDSALGGLNIILLCSVIDCRGTV